LGSTFAWSGIAKLANGPSWRAALSRYRLPEALRRPSAVAVPLIELCVPASLLAGATRAGAALCIALLSAFSLAVLRARRLQGDRLPCGCFGKTKVRDFKTMLVRNGALGAVAAALLLNGEDVPPFAGFEMDPGSDLVPVALTIAGVAVAAWLVWSVMHPFRRQP
ncbi:MAG TPA: MauE/DoxX family redox-associated membrane protein, partial [Actinomycetota bacterium]|nr:MauE/DoxX family redox-associated membrane protein [Actinomycetota bacterium]